MCVGSRRGSGESYYQELAETNVSNQRGPGGRGNRELRGCFHEQPGASISPAKNWKIVFSCV
ncbi:hypothetical protein ZHAS_00018777 [Anopheles sinensis]|uniref:Uncharacterized protein n=1 Tax=Anopheles sinensis TaxID=74873 RepID=A0A084WKI8_ANOSI|nr:hypothetical protein ZHAS_00018777 [Anopheles sinensis]